VLWWLEEECEEVDAVNNWTGPWWFRNVFISHVGMVCWADLLCVQSTVLAVPAGSVD
jgi:hypothetical protein